MTKKTVVKAKAYPYREYKLLRHSGPWAYIGACTQSLGDDNQNGLVSYLVKVPILIFQALTRR